MKKFCVLQKKVLCFWPNQTVKVRPNNSAESKIWSVTTCAFKLYCCLKLSPLVTLFTYTKLEISKITILKTALYT